MTVAWVTWDQAQPEDDWVGQPERGPVSAPRRSLRVASPPWPAVVGQGSRLSTNPTIAPRLPAAADTGPHSLGAARVPEQMCWRCRWLGHFHQNCPVLKIYSTEDFPQEQSHDHQMVCPDPTLSLPHFLMRGYIECVMTLGCRKSTPCCRYRKSFSSQHFSSHGIRKNSGMNHWPGIQVDVRRCPLVNQPTIPKATLCLLLLIEVPFELIGKDLLRPFHLSA